MTGAMFEARGLVFRHGGMVAVDRVYLRAEPGSVTAVIGPNGAGKTTLFDCLSGVRTPAEGQVLLDGLDVTPMTTDERARHGIARTFQHSSVFETLTVWENLLIGAENRSRSVTVREILGIGSAESRARSALVERVLADMELTGLRDVPAGQLPTGTLRNVELARALCMRPKVMLLDEPASGLDDVEVGRLREQLATQAARGMTVVLIEHDISLVGASADVVYAMVAGRVIASGASGEVLDRADVRAAVLGLAG